MQFPDNHSAFNTLRTFPELLSCVTNKLYQERNKKEKEKKRKIQIHVKICSEVNSPQVQQFSHKMQNVHTPH